MIKLVATDIDGTLLQSGEREVPEAMWEPAVWRPSWLQPGLPQTADLT